MLHAKIGLKQTFGWKESWLLELLLNVTSCCSTWLISATPAASQSIRCIVLDLWQSLVADMECLLLFDFSCWAIRKGPARH